MMNANEKKEFFQRRGRAIAQARVVRSLTEMTPAEAKRARAIARVLAVVGSERQLSRELGCSYASMGEYFRGETSVPAHIDRRFREAYPELGWWNWPAGVAR